MKARVWERAGRIAFLVLMVLDVDLAFGEFGRGDRIGGAFYVASALAAAVAVILAVVTRR